MFNRQAVTVPTGDVGVVALHPLKRRIVLEGLVQGVAEVQVAIGKGRTVVQDEVRPCAFFAWICRTDQFFPVVDASGLSLTKSPCMGSRFEED